MNANAKKWVAALRSGDFDQTTGVLHDEAGYCCLGVACELYRRETGQGEWESEVDEGFHRDTLRFLGEPSTLPNKVREWLGLTDESGNFVSEGLDVFGYDALVAANDAGEPFDAIARIIEAEPEGLFEP